MLGRKIVLVIGAFTSVVIIFGIILTFERTSASKTSSKVSDYEGHVSESILEAQSEAVFLADSVLQKCFGSQRNSTFLIIRIKSSQCQACYNFFLSDIEMLIARLDSAAILFCLYDMHPNDERNLFSAIGEDINTIQVESLGIVADLTRKPYILVVNSDGFIEKCHIYREALPSVNDMAFENIIRRISLAPILVLNDKD